MKKEEAIRDLKENFELLRPGSSSQSIAGAIRSLNRAISLLQTDDKKMNLRLKKIAADLMSAYTSQVQYSELKNKSENPGLKVKPEFDESFFESLGILKAELYQLLDKL